MGGRFVTIWRCWASLFLFVQSCAVGSCVLVLASSHQLVETMFIVFFVLHIVCD